MSHPIKHFRTITKHRHRVIAHCRRAGILWQGLRHDLSKYSPTEFFAGAKYYAGTHSPNENERRDKGYSLAWMHHKGRNRHHFEYWTDVNPKTKRVEPVDMPEKYIIEMFCDRVGASKIYAGDKYTDRYPLEYFLRGKATRAITKATSDKIEFLLTYLADHGEKETFALIKSCRKSGIPSIESYEQNN